MLPEDQDVFDIESALEFMGGDRELLAELIEQFLEDIPRLLQELTQAIQQQDQAIVERAAHTLKGSLATFAAHSATEAAFSLEQIGRENRLNEAAGAFQQLKAELERLKPVLMNAGGN